MLERQFDQSGSREPDDVSRALADARNRWTVDRDLLLSADGPPLTMGGVCRLLGISAEAVARARDEHRIVGVPDKDGTHLYPQWQFDSSGPMFGLRELTKALSDDDPWTLIAFVLS